MKETLDTLDYLAKVKNRFSQAYRERTEKHFAEIIEQEKLQAPAPVSNISDDIKQILTIVKNKDEELKKLETEVSKLNQVLAYRGKKMKEEQSIEDLVKLNRLHKIMDKKKGLTMVNPFLLYNLP